MKLSEIIKRDGIEQVMQITNISEKNLEDLASEEFSNLNRVKALGFLLILEREYPEMNVEELREQIKEQFEEKVVSKENVVALTREKPMEEQVSYFKWFVILALVGGGIYLYTQGQLNGLLNNISDKEEVFDDSQALENNISDENAEKVMVEEESEEQEVVIDTNETLNVITPILAMEATNEVEGNVTTDANSSIAIVQPLVSSVVDINATEDTNSTAATTISTITINPTRGMLWYGFINLDTKKRKEFMKKESTPFDIKDGRWLLIVGHGFVDIVSEIKTVEIGDRNKHYFYIDSSEIRELTQKEFRDMNGRRGW